MVSLAGNEMLNIDIFLTLVKRLSVELWRELGPHAIMWRNGMLINWKKQAQLLIELECSEGNEEVTQNEIKMTTVGETDALLLQQADTIILRFFNKVNQTNN